MENLSKHKHVFLKAFFIVGVVEETLESLEETRKMIKALPLDKFSINYATPFPGTALFNQTRALGLLQYDVEDYVDMEGHQARSDKPHFIPPALKEGNLIEFLKWADEYQKQKEINAKKLDPRGAGDLNIPLGQNFKEYWDQRITT